jgi:15-cis-phytoene synthase
VTSSGGAARASELSAHYAFCEAELREKDRDSWLAALFAPAERRRQLHAIRAFVVEIAEAREKVTQPLLGEMRLRWWADTIEQSSGANAHPVADALADTISQNCLDQSEFLAFLDARVADFYDDPTPSLAALQDYCSKADALPLRWCALALGCGAPLCGEASAALEAAGTALGLTRILWGLPRQGGARALLPADLLARHGVAAGDIEAGRDSKALRAALAELRALARAMLASAKAASPRLDAAARAALLFAAAAPLYLERMEASDYQPFQPLAAPSAWRRQWRLWRAARGGF